MSTALFTVVKIEICEAVGKCKISGYLWDHRSTSRETHPTHRNNKKRSHTQLDSRKQVIAFQDRVITLNIKEAQHPLKWEKQVIDKSSIMLKISTKSMHRVLVWEIGPANNTTRCSRLSKRRLLHAWHPSQLAINLSIDKSKWQIHSDPRVTFPRFKVN